MINPNATIQPVTIRFPLSGSSIAYLEYDFSSFYNTTLAADAVKFFQLEYEKGVGMKYLSVLSTALLHYDEYLKKSGISDKPVYDTTQKERYAAYLRSLRNAELGIYSENYIRFLKSVPYTLAQSLKTNAIKGGSYDFS